MNTEVRNVNREHRQSFTRLEKIAVWITGHIGTIEFAIFCIILVSIPLIWKSTMSVVLYISSGYLQLVMLPLIMMGQNLQNRHSEKRAEADYEVDVKNDHLIKDIIARLDIQEKEIKELLQEIRSKK
jgi:uncharacterized membrane protein